MEQIEVIRLCSHSKIIQYDDKSITKFDELISLEDVRAYDTPPKSFKCCDKEAKNENY